MTEENNIQQPEGAAANPPAGQPPVDSGQPDYYSRFAQDFGFETIDENGYKEFINKVKNPEPAKPVFEEQWETDLYTTLRSVSDPNERKRALNEFAFYNGTDWDAVMQADPSVALKAALRIEHPDASEMQLNALYNKRYSNLKTDPNSYLDEDGDPLPGVHNPQEEAALAQLEMKNALARAKELIDKRRTDLRPKQKPGLIDEAAKTYSEAAKAVLSSFKAGDGDATYTLGEQDIAELSKPEVVGKFFDDLIQNGKLNLGLVAEYFALKKVHEKGIPALIEKARGKGTASVLDLLENPSNKETARTPGGKNVGFDKDTIQKGGRNW